ncbi:MAG: hypothetical protein JRJ29_08630 [Deltaproteobacteria bacterium]|nr:hypothetical protein [Deltaproteobacteria bacterium]
MDKIICYCFGYTEQDIIEDYVENGRSLIMERILAEKKNGECDCSHKNPRGK